MFLTKTCQQMIYQSVLLILGDIARSIMLIMLLYFSLICRCQKYLQHRVNAKNTMLMNRCKNYGLVYIDKSNIEVGFLAQDGLHLNEIVKGCLANNFISFINRYIL